METEFIVYEDLSYDIIEGDGHEDEVKDIITTLTPLESDSCHYSIQFNEDGVTVYLWNNDTGEGVPVS